MVPVSFLLLTFPIIVKGIEPLCVEASTFAEKFGAALKFTPPLWISIDTSHTAGANPR